LRVRNPLHNHRPARLAELVQNGLRRRHNYFPCRPHGLRALCRRGLGCALYRPGGPLRGRSPQRCPPPCCSCRSCCSHRLCSHRAALPSPPGFSRLLRHARSFRPFTSFSQRCCGPCACCCASSCPAWGKPRVSAGDCPSLCLHRRRAGDPLGSWPRREPLA
jgi:hypothetical protein